MDVSKRKQIYIVVFVLFAAGLSLSKRHWGICLADGALGVMLMLCLYFDKDFAALKIPRWFYLAAAAIMAVATAALTVAHIVEQGNV